MLHLSFTERAISTGFGQHADYVFGWEGDSLQRAMDECPGSIGMPVDCTKVLTEIHDEEINQCTQREVVPEKTHGCERFFSALPALNLPEY